MKKTDTVVLPSLRVNERLAKKMDLIVRKENFTSRAEFMRRALEVYTTKFFEERERPKSAEELLKLVYKRTGRVPRMKKSPREIFREGYEEEGLL